MKEIEDNSADVFDRPERVVQEPITNTKDQKDTKNVKKEKTKAQQSGPNRKR